MEVKMAQAEHIDALVLGSGVGGNLLALGAIVLKVNVYVTSVDMFRTVNEVYRRFFPKDPLPRIFINVPAWNGGFDIEVDCVAAV
jgi:enamine deaminase RidA (YjgF/YER057c/UK114 family)